MPSVPSSKQSQDTFFDPEEEGFIDDYEDNYDQASNYNNPASSQNDPTDNYPVVPGKLKKNQMKTPKKPRPLTTTAAFRAQDARRRSQNLDRR
ncbi:uncharacterized protein LOC142341779 [Convolutriloba macropyga]|uniref:uncharacterized protein LOC142341779 n=1 Tax=Convolutriloba macropyga TaxID=536237 RepID=UPI003F51EC80